MYTHCEAWCDDICELTASHNNLLMLYLEKHDKSKKDIGEIVSKAQALGSYEHLQTNEKDILITTLEETQAAHNMGIVWHPMGQMHDVWATTDHVCCEVSFQIWNLLTFY